MKITRVKYTLSLVVMFVVGASVERQGHLRWLSQGWLYLALVLLVLTGSFISWREHNSTPGEALKRVGYGILGGIGLAVLVLVGIRLNVPMPILLWGPLVLALGV